MTKERKLSKATSGINRPMLLINIAGQDEDLECNREGVEIREVCIIRV